jgi:hypothetical protein
MNPLVSLPLSLSLAAWVGLFSTANATPLPDNSTTATSSTAFQITNTGTGKAGQFDINNSANGAPALTATSNGTGYGLFSLMTGTGRGGYFQINNAANTSYALGGVSNGTGYSVYGLMNGTGRAGYFQITNAANPRATLEATTNGSGSAIKAWAGTGLAGEFLGNVTASGSVLSGGTLGSSGSVLELRANGERLYRLEKPAADPYYGTAPNLIGGFRGNNVAAGSLGATISGGGWSGAINQVSGLFGTVGGGHLNASMAHNATVSGGYGNTASGLFSTVSGGGSNMALTGDYATVGGGGSNIAIGSSSTVSGGYDNLAGHYSTVSGGVINSANGQYATVSGGNQNTASGDYSAINGGDNNTASGLQSTVSGGYSNTASGDSSIVAGGYLNTASGVLSMVVGGFGNTASARSTFAAGGQAQAIHPGSFVWADGHAVNIYSTDDNEFTARATGGVRFITGINESLGDVYGTPIAGLRLAPGGSQWLAISDRNMKNHFRSLDPRQVLDKFSRLPLTEWSYKAQDPSIRHIGPMAQDFYAAFGLGEDRLRIGTMDADGVMMAAIQGLNTKVNTRDQKIIAQEKQIAQLQKQNIEMTKKNAEMETRLARLERRLTPKKSR